MPSICLYFHIHQPRRLKKYSLFHLKQNDLEAEYINDSMNRHYFEKAAEKCYTPALKLLLRLVLENYGKFKFSLSITGTFLEQAKKSKSGREIIDTLKQLSQTNCVEFLDETYYHSLSSLYIDKTEFISQVKKHTSLIQELFGQTPKVFRNTELIYSNEIASVVESMGYTGILTEGIEHVLGWKSPNYVYKNLNGNLKVLLRNYKLSDDVGYRFSAKWWPDWPLTADKYASWLSSTQGDIINLFMDFETFGEHHWKGTGIFDFLAHFPKEALNCQNLSFKTVSETLQNEAKDQIDVPYNLSWADMERDVSAWLGNKLQAACFFKLQQIGEKTSQLNNENLSHVFRLLQTSDHLYYICTKSWADGDVHKHFSPYKENTPYDNFINYMNILRDFEMHLDQKLLEKEKEQNTIYSFQKMLKTKNIFESASFSALAASRRSP
ncbi:alpha-amylase [Candidatus Micrarchaeota archaeon]|nr:alpha-amylase [Candidatus Micrarchaeota archaeon]